MAMSDVLVIGAGPFGLSVSAHLRRRGIEHTIVGRPMDTWHNHMPVGMFLKSEPYGSVIDAGKPGYDIATYSTLNGFDDYIDRIGPLSIERFVGYGDWFADQLVPDVRDLTVTSVTPVGDGFRVEFADAAPVRARQVIVATGLLPYANIPAQLAGLPPELMTHTHQHHHMDTFSGRRVAIIGAGQSALQTAALMHENGTDVEIIARRPDLVWEEQLPPKVQRFRRPPANLCEGWACVAYDSPDLFRLLPPSLRQRKARSTFPPSGAWWLRHRVEGVLEALTSHKVISAEPHGSGVRLHLDGPRQSVIDADHVIAGTGFRINVARLSFLSEAIQSALTTRGDCPLVNRAGESSVPGLYFAGAHSMVSQGPGVRFISGTHQTSAQTAKSVDRYLRKGGPSRPADLDATVPMAAAGSAAA